MLTTLRLTGPVMALGWFCFTNLALGAPLLELTVGSDAYVGKSLGHDSEVCWLAQRDGRVTGVPLHKVTSFRKVGKSFRRLETVEIRDSLRREFGHDWEIVGTGHYLVCAPQGRAQLFAGTFEDLYRSFRGYFSRRGFDLPQPEFPMIAVVYPTQQAFAANCAKDGVPFVHGLKGYYHRLTNRTSLFEDGIDRLAAVPPPPLEDHTVTHPGRLDGLHALARFAAADFRGLRWDGSIQSDLKDTIVHEATHQVAYNLGLHTRIGENPKWITEGLATMFEAEGTRENTGGKRPQQRLNRERFERFTHYAQHSRRQRSLAKFVMSDRAFQSQVLDAYAESWALTFFLVETRSGEYSKFLKTVSARDPMQSYSAQQRLTDFQSAFGNDLDRLEVSFLRFMEDLQ